MSFSSLFLSMFFAYHHLHTILCPLIMYLIILSLSVNLSLYPHRRIFLAPLIFILTSNLRLSLLLFSLILLFTHLQMGSGVFDLRLREAGLSPLPNNNCNGRKPDSRTPFTQTFIITFNLDRSLCLCFNSHFCVFTLCSMFVCLAEQAILEALMWKTFNFQTTKHSLRHKLKTFKARRQERQSKTLSTYSFSVPSTTNHTLEMFLKWDIVCILFVYFPIFSNNLQN